MPGPGLGRRRRCADCGRLMSFMVERIVRTNRHVFRLWVCETCAEKAAAADEMATQGVAHGA